MHPMRSESLPLPAECELLPFSCRTSRASRLLCLFVAARDFFRHVAERGCGSCRPGVGLIGFGHLHAPIAPTRMATGECESTTLGSGTARPTLRTKDQTRLLGFGLSQDPSLAPGPVRAPDRQSKGATSQANHRRQRGDMTLCQKLPTVISRKLGTDLVFRRLAFEDSVLGRADPPVMARPRRYPKELLDRGVRLSGGTLIGEPGTVAS